MPRVRAKLPFQVNRPLLLTLLALGLAAPAHAYVGERLVDWTLDNVVVGLGIVSILIALGASLFRPEVARTALYAALVCAVLFLVGKSAGQIASLLTAG